MNRVEPCAANWSKSTGQSARASAGLLVVLCFLAGFSMLTQRSVAQTSRKADVRCVSARSTRMRATGSARSSPRSAATASRAAPVSASPTTPPSSAWWPPCSGPPLDPSPAVARDRRPAAGPPSRLSRRQSQAVRGRRRRRRRRRPALRPRGHRSRLRRPRGHRLAAGRRRPADRARAQRLARAPRARGRRGRSPSRSASASCCSPASPLIILRFRRRLDAARAAELERLAEIAITDPLTGLRNHRAFHEDLARELQRVSRTGEPLALVLLDLDDLKTVNDKPRPPGRRRAPAGARRRDPRHAARRRLRLPHRRRRVRGHRSPAPARSARWSSPSACARPRRATGSRSPSPPASPRRRAALEGRADPRGRPRADRRQAHPPGRRDLRRPTWSPRPAGAEPRTSTTAARWPARSPARSTPRTPTPAATARPCRSCARVIAAELGFDGDRLPRMRLAGLLHDVGKIGVPGRDPQQARGAHRRRVRA